MDARRAACSDAEADDDSPSPAAGDEPAGPAPASKRRRPERTPVQTALGLLTRREHSRRELERKLSARGFEADAAAAAIERLADAGWQDDSRFAAGLVRSRAAAGYGPIRIRAELTTHGLDGDAIQHAMESEPVDWAEAARDLIGRRFGAERLRDIAQRRRAADFLIRRGFPSDVVRTAVRMDLSND